MNISHYPLIVRWFLGTFITITASLHIFLFSYSPIRGVIEQDVKRWLQVTGYSESQVTTPLWKGLVWLIWSFPEFRNLLYYRLSGRRPFWKRLLLEVAKFLYKPMDSLYIWTPSIGPGLFIQHGFSTVIAANRLGENCWINQQVTIGFSDNKKRPTLGDHVTITAGAKVIGGVTIGDYSIVGANAVVTKDVPPHCTVVGIPAYIVKRNGQKVRESLE